MRIPRQIMIGDSLWDVRFRRNLEPDRPRGDNTIGLCDPSTSEITIKTNLRPRERLETLIHECLHAIEFEWDKDIPHELIYWLEGKLAQVLIDNFIGPV